MLYRYVRSIRLMNIQLTSFCTVVPIKSLDWTSALASVLSAVEIIFACREFVVHRSGVMGSDHRKAAYKAGDVHYPAEATNRRRQQVWPHLYTV